jgi:hypothetical protein
MIAPLSTTLQLALSAFFCIGPLVIVREGSEHSDAAADSPTDNDEEIQERGNVSWSLLWFFSLIHFPHALGRTQEWGQ